MSVTHTARATSRLHKRRCGRSLKTEQEPTGKVDGRTMSMASRVKVIYLNDVRSSSSVGTTVIGHDFGKSMFSYESLREKSERVLS